MIQYFPQLHISRVSLHSVHDAQRKDVLICFGTCESQTGFFFVFFFLNQIQLIFLCSEIKKKYIELLKNISTLFFYCLKKRENIEEHQTGKNKNRKNARKTDTGVFFFIL